MAVDFSIINLNEFNESEYGDDIESIISDFTCPKNSDVEKFLHKSAMEFTKKKQSVTYLVLSSDDGSLLGYFSLAVKPITIEIGNNATDISKTMRRKIERVSKFDEMRNCYVLSAYLIAQLGKNFSDNANQKITDSQLLQLAVNQIKEVQGLIGGMVIFLEAERTDKLLKFYISDNGFVEFGSRYTENKDDPHELVQMLKVI